MLNHKQLSKANDLKRQAYLILLLAELVDFHEKQSAQSRKNAKYAYSTSVYAELAIEYIKDMYQKGIGISDIADNIGISRAYLNSSFQKELGMSAQTFLIDYKQPVFWSAPVCLLKRLLIMWAMKTSLFFQKLLRRSLE